MNTASRNTDPHSSHLAESDITTSGERQHQNGIALDVVTLFPGLTSKELSEHCPLDRYQLARRLNDLYIKNKVDKTDGKNGEQKWYKGSGKILPTPEKPIEALQSTQQGNNTTVQGRGAFKGQYKLSQDDRGELIKQCRQIQQSYPENHVQYQKIGEQVERLKCKA